MIRRFFSLQCCLALLLLASFSPAVPNAPTPVRVGRAAPALISEAGSAELVVTWAFPTEALHRCSSPASEFRRLQRTYGDRFKLIVVAVGDDPGILEPFLRRERLTPHVYRLAPDDYAQHLGTTPLPAVHIVRERVVQETVSDTTWADGVPLSQRGIQRTVEAFLQ